VKVKVKFFAMFHEMFARREEKMKLSEDSTVMDILKRLATEKPQFVECYDSMQISVNWEYAEKNTRLQDGDEVALIPPVTGG